MDQLNFSMRQTGGVTIIELSGSILFGESSSELFLNFRSLVDAGKRYFIIDMKRVTAIDAGGLGILVGAHVELAAAGGWLRVAAPDPQVTQLIEVGKLDAVFDIFADQSDAIAGSNARSRPGRSENQANVANSSVL